MGVVLLVRHGQASFGAADYDVLSETGLEQSRVLGRALAAQSLSPTAVVHGAMKRQGDTALAMVEDAGWSLTPEVDAGWDEFDHLAVVARGGGCADDARSFSGFEAATARWFGGRHDEQYAESWPVFVNRVGDALDRALSRDGVTVVVSSGGAIAVACARVVAPDATTADLPRWWTVFNTVSVNSSVTRVLEGATGRRLLSFNEHLHLPRELVTHR